MSFTSLVVQLFSLRLAPAYLPSFFSNWHLTITSCLLALFLRSSCEKHMKGLEFLQVKEKAGVSSAASHVQNPAEKPREFQRERRTEKSVRKIRKINQEKIGGDLIFNLSSFCYLEKDQKPQAYLGEEDQLRPSSPFVRLGKLWSPSLSQYLIITVHGYHRSWSDQLCGALLVPSCPFSFVQEELKSCPTQ
ncbi:hypothetical protein IGI04_036389, partial [Brassica rapa subsp. trilocularis]